MRKHLNKKKLINFYLLSVIFVILFSITSFCRGWELDEYGNHRYKNEDGSYVTNARLSLVSAQNKIQKIQQLNAELYLLSATSPYEGLYYSDVRKKLLEYNSYGLNMFAQFYTDSILSNSLNLNNYIFDPSNIITYSDVIIPEYTGSGMRLKEAEKKVAKNFEANYECKTYGDLIYEMISKHRDLFSDEWNILINLDEKTGHYLYLGRSELTLEEYLTASQFMEEVTEFNPQKLVYSEQGYMTNFKN